MSCGKTYPPRTHTHIELELGPGTQKSLLFLPPWNLENLFFLQKNMLSKLQTIIFYLARAGKKCRNFC